MFNFRSLFCSHNYAYVGESTTKVNNATFKNFILTDGYYEWSAPVKCYMCKKCGKIKRVVIK